MSSDYSTHICSSHSSVTFFLHLNCNYCVFTIYQEIDKRRGVEKVREDESDFLNS